MFVERTMIFNSIISSLYGVFFAFFFVGNSAIAKTAGCKCPTVTVQDGSRLKPIENNCSGLKDAKTCSAKGATCKYRSPWVLLNTGGTTDIHVPTFETPCDYEALPFE